MRWLILELLVTVILCLNSSVWLRSVKMLDQFLLKNILICISLGWTYLLKNRITGHLLILLLRKNLIFLDLKIVLWLITLKFVEMLIIHRFSHHGTLIFQKTCRTLVKICLVSLMSLDKILMELPTDTSVKSHLKLRLKIVKFTLINLCSNGLNH